MDGVKVGVNSTSQEHHLHAVSGVTMNTNMATVRISEAEQCCDAEYTAELKVRAVTNVSADKRRVKITKRSLSTRPSSSVKSPGGSM
jgi:hypothetical protein